ncbi:T9SS type A sorting domain-containing protein [Dyadobacter tibetensis]|uniref:T9SS type A sorting domain-containing protein n=1 Tax=Dyadobacter tibetensis TaxID=1211851 RepID=UPI0004AF82C6|nr:T9SS type A sorting domain-containing protein [Dyadobacter tibetensis]
MKKALIFSLMLAGFTPCLAQSVDLELASISTTPTSIPAGSQGIIDLNFKQNGPDALPANAARISVSINTNVVRYTSPLSITDNCGNLWSITNDTDSASGQILISNSAPIPNASNCILTIPVEGVVEEQAVVTVASTILSPSVSDRDGTNQGTFKNFQVGTPLPVRLASFEVRREGSTALLNWATTEESNSSYFEVQHSADAKTWSKLGQVNSKGEGVMARNYSFNHPNTVDGENFYRLKMVDRDATFAFSRIRNIKFEKDATRITLSPNPASELLKVDTPDWSLVKSLQIVDFNGRSIYRTSTPPSENQVSVKNLSTGMYLLRITHNDGQTSVHKFMVNR